MCSTALSSSLLLSETHSVAVMSHTEVEINISIIYQTLEEEVQHSLCRYKLDLYVLTNVLQPRQGASAAVYSSVTDGVL